MIRSRPTALSDSSDFDIVILALTDVASDSRVLRQLNAARSLGSVACISPGSIKLPGITHFSLPSEISKGPWARRASKLLRLTTLSAGQHDRYYWSRPLVRELALRCSSISSRVIIANDLETLPVAIRRGRNAAVIFDAHEFYPGQQSSSDMNGRLWNRYSDELCRRYMPSASSVLTVSPGIGKLYGELYGVECLECLNCPATVDCTPTASGDDGRIRLVHHGAYRSTRGIERLVRMMPLLPDHFELHLILTGDRESSGFRALQREAATTGKVTIHSPVAPDEIALAINRFDIGVYLLDPINLNHQLALPNKFFEFIQARLAIAIGPSPEMASIVDRHGLGIVSDDFNEASLASRLATLSPEDVRNFKKNSNRAAQIYTAENSTRTLCDEVVSLLNRSPQKAA